MLKKRFIQLIDKYLVGCATDTEQQIVDEYLDRLEASSNIEPDKEHEQKVKEEMWQKIGIEALLRQPKIISIVEPERKLVRYIAVAASIILLVGFGLFFLGKHKQSDAAIAVKTDKPKDSALFVVHREVNTSGKEKRIALPDGSFIVLYNKSEITYTLPFTNKRMFVLAGKGYFEVAKDSTKPFTVISGDISTTALGTEFTVTAFKSAKQIVVRLFQGKVVVKAVSSKNTRLKRNVYLRPGEAFIYNYASRPKAKVSEPKDIEEDEHVDNTNRDNPTLPQQYDGMWYMFNNQQLYQVFDQLAAMYNVTIIYNKKDVKNKYFIGKFNKSDSLDMILGYIAAANKLTVTKKENIYTIIKK